MRSLFVCAVCELTPGGRFMERLLDSLTSRGHCEREFASGAEARLDGDVPTVAHRDLLAQEEPEAGAGDAHILLRGQAAEAGEKDRLVLGGDPDTFVADADEDVSAEASGRDADLTAPGRVLQGVVHQVGDDGRDPRPVAFHQQGLVRALDDEMVALGQRPEYVELLLDGPSEGELLARELESL